MHDALFRFRSNSFAFSSEPAAFVVHSIIPFHPPVPKLRLHQLCARCIVCQYAPVQPQLSEESLQCAAGVGIVAWCTLEEIKSSPVRCAHYSAHWRNYVRHRWARPYASSGTLQLLELGVCVNYRRIIYVVSELSSKQMHSDKMYLFWRNIRWCWICLIHMRTLVLKNTHTSWVHFPNVC